MKKIFILIVTMILISGCSFREEATNDIYLIPDDFEGSIFVFYDIPKQPRLKKEGDLTVIPVKIKSLKTYEGTGMEEYGIYMTSTKDMKYGTVNDRFYYLGGKGKRKRTSINEQCIHHSRDGGFTNTSGKEFNYRAIQITKRDCGQPFFLDGKDEYYEQMDEVAAFWMQHFENSDM